MKTKKLSTTEIKIKKILRYSEFRMLKYTDLNAAFKTIFIKKTKYLKKRTKH